MPLQRTRKTVIFHEGMSDGTDRFLLEPPSTDYIENLHFTKDGSLQKRMGFGPDPLTTVNSPTGDVIAFHSIGDEIYVLTTNGLHVYSEGVWTLTTVPGFIGTDAVAVETQPFPGMGHFDAYCETGGPEPTYVVAFEVREESAADPSVYPQDAIPKHVIVQSYSSDGRFIGQQRIDNAQSPKLAADSLGFLRLFWQQINTRALWVRAFNPSTATFLGVAPVSVGISPSAIYGLEAHASKLSKRAEDPFDWRNRSMRHTRIGASVDGFARYHVVYNSTEARYFILYQAEQSVVLARLNSALQVDIATVVHDATASTWDPGSGPQPIISGEAFAIETLNNVPSVVVMWCEYRKGTYTGFYVPQNNGRTEVHVARYRTSDLVQEWTSMVRQDTGFADLYTGSVYTHGALLARGSFTVQWFVHCSGPAPCRSQLDNNVGFPNILNTDTDLEAVRDYWDTSITADTPPTGLFYGSVSVLSGAELDPWNLAVGQRLASLPFEFKGRTYALLQQWSDMTPYSFDVGTCEAWTNMLPISTPRTSVLAHINMQERTVSPVAVLDAGQSLICQYTESEFITHLPQVTIDGDNIVVPNRMQLQAEDASSYFGGTGPTGFNRLGYSEAPSDAMVRIHRVTDVVNAKDIATCNLGDGLIIGASVPLWFDGRSLIEVSPFTQPEIVSVTDESIKAELKKLPTQAFNDTFQNINGTTNPWRKMAVVIGYYDNAGNKHRSAPSNTVYVADIYPNGLGWPETWRGKEVYVRIPSILSMRPAGSEYFMEVYASDTADSDMLLVTTASIELGDLSEPNTFRGRSQLIRAILSVDGGDNTDFESPPRTSEPLYTTGGVLAADPWPSFKASIATSTRLWVLDAVNKGRVIPSKLFEDYIAPEYNGSLAINLGDERELTAIGKLDDKVVIFEANDIHVIYGDGPDNRGQGQDFAVHYISTDVGCTNQKSIIETPVGLIFHSDPRGFYLLDRNLQVQFIGGGVEDIGSGIDIVAATLVPEEAEVRFVFTGGPASSDDFPPNPGTQVIVGPPVPRLQNVAPQAKPCALVYNYENKQWTLFSNYGAVAAIMYQNKYTLLRSDWDIWQESEDRYDDPSGFNTTRLVTPWIKLAEAVQDYTRVWQLKVLGRYLSSLQDMGGGAYEAGDLNIDIYYDYEPVPSETKVYKVQDFGYDPFNNPLRRPERFQLTIEPGRGRCQAIKLRFYETLSADMGEGLTYAQGRGFEITAVDFDLGVSPMRPLLPAGVRR